MKLFYANGSSWIAARRALWKKYGEEARKIHVRTIQRQVTRFERELTLRRKPTGGGAKTAVILITGFSGPTLSRMKMRR